MRRLESFGKVCRVGTGLALVALLGGTAAAQTTGYVVDQRGQPIRNNWGGCIKSPYWVPSNATAECDPDLVPRRAAPAPVPAPRVNAPAPARPATAAPAVRPAPAPAPARPAAAPARAAAVAAAPAVERVNLSADALFDYGKASLKPGSAAELDKFVARVKGVNPEKILVVGHADRLGSAAGNARLSTARADAVKGYLVKKGLPERSIAAEGRGSKEPRTTSQCKGAKGAKLVQCLQPDRRVEIQLIGSRSR